MYLTKKQSKVLALLVIASFFVIASLQLRFSRPTPVVDYEGLENSAATPAEPAQPATIATDGATTPHGAITLGEFERSYTKEGRKLWEVKAVHGSMIPGTNQAQLADAHFTFYQKNGESLVLFAPKSVLEITGQQLTSVVSTGGIKFELPSQELILLAPQATYTAATELVEVEENVTITTPRVNLSGKKLLLKIEEESFTMTGDVKTHIEPKVE